MQIDHVSKHDNIDHIMYRNRSMAIFLIFFVLKSDLISIISSFHRHTFGNLNVAEYVLNIIFVYQFNQSVIKSA